MLRTFWARLSEDNCVQIDLIGGETIDVRFS